MMSEARMIKKYPNRRLYDTLESRYITLQDVRKLVIDRVDITVVDKQTSEDITRSILLQVIAEQEHGGEHLMSRDFLSQVIRCYGGSMQGVVGSYLEQSLKLFTSQKPEGAEPTPAARPAEGQWPTVQDEIYQTLLAAPQPHAEEEIKSA
jgi:polyhydroxyalkanoate synthesis repressor PhaR